MREGLSPELSQRSETGPAWISPARNASMVLASCKGGKEIKLSTANPNSAGILRKKEGEDSHGWRPLYHTTFMGISSVGIFWICY